MDLEHWVNDGLMALFFFVIGLEVRREFSVGELTQPRRAAIPVLAAVGGLVVPALIYVALAPGGEAGRAWGLVIGTDTAFMLGALAVVGPRFATQLRIFLLTLTVIDDIVAVSVIGLVLQRLPRPWRPGRDGGPRRRDGPDEPLRRGTHGSPISSSALPCGWRRCSPGLHASIAGMLGGLLVAAHRTAPRGRRACGAPVPRLPPVTRGGVRPFGRPRARPRRVGQRTSPGQAAPLGQLRGRPGVRFRQRRHRPTRRGPTGRVGFDDSPGPWWLPSSSASSSASVLRPGPAYAPAWAGFPLASASGTSSAGPPSPGSASPSPCSSPVSPSPTPTNTTRQSSASSSRRCSRPCSAGWHSVPRPCSGARATPTYPGSWTARRPRGRPHPRPRRRPPHPRRVRRVRVPVLRPRHRCRPRAARAVRRRPPLRVPSASPRRRPPARRARRPGRRCRRSPGALLGDARPPVAHQDQLEYEDIAGYAADLDLDVEQFLRDLEQRRHRGAGARRRGECRGQRSTRHANLLRRRPPAHRPPRHRDPGTRTRVFKTGLSPAAAAPTGPDIPRKTSKRPVECNAGNP